MVAFEKDSGVYFYAFFLVLYDSPIETYYIKARNKNIIISNYIIKIILPSNLQQPVELLRPSASVLLSIVVQNLPIRVWKDSPRV